MNQTKLALSNTQSLTLRIQKSAEKVGRDASQITLIGASKQQNAEKLAAFYRAGVTDLGENYLQEAREKQQALTDLAIRWHFIGAIQSRKCKEIAEHFSWVHGVDRFKVANKLNQFTDARLNVLIQINVDSEDSKSGVALKECAELADQIAQLEKLNLRGLMVIPKARLSIEEQRKPFALAYQTMQQANQRYGLQMDTLSMGMSNDLEAAIAEGSTMIRVGTALFGKRG